MGKDDTQTRRGKIYNGSHGRKRPGRMQAENASQPSPILARSGSGR